VSDESGAERKVIPFEEAKPKKDKPQRHRYAAGNSKRWPPGSAAPAQTRTSEPRASV
jgi:hypothetical protein